MTTQIEERSLELITDALSYLQTVHQEQRTTGPLVDRRGEIQAQIEETGTYTHTFEELEVGARVAWRNSVRCIGRLHWKSLQVRDMRHLTSASEIFEALLEHICLATNGGKLRSMISIFAPPRPGEPGIRIWNPQLIRYAGYELMNGRVIGDPALVDFTNICFQLGWNGGKITPFDILPLVIQMPNQKPKLFELPPDIVLEVPLSHPDYPWFAELGLKWHVLPAVSNMCLEIGGISYTAAPFNGWYVSTEIGARNLADQGRYNMLPLVASRLGLNRSSDRTLWKDRALVELNRAVLHSFAEHRATIVDHHTVSRQFVVHTEKEKQAGRCVYGDWGWIVPPMSGSTTQPFHENYENKEISPNFYGQVAPWKTGILSGLCPYAEGATYDQQD
jgi:nitric-oxide synthase